MIPRVLVIAGSDSSGGAGIQADLKTVSVLGAYGMTAITAVTAQNTRGVFRVVQMDARFVAQQMEACLADIGCDAVKTGILVNSDIVETVAEKIREHSTVPLVVDPVLISTSGRRLLEQRAVKILKSKLLPLATVVTPNLGEAGALIGRQVRNLREMKEAARMIRDLGPEQVIVKGGHLKGEAVDLLFDGHDFIEYRVARIRTKNSHGTGCIFASAIAAGLAKGKTVKESVAVAKTLVTAALRSSLALGSGYGPANPMATIKVRS